MNINFVLKDHGIGGGGGKSINYIVGNNPIISVIYSTGVSLGFAPNKRLILSSIRINDGGGRLRCISRVRASNATPMYYRIFVNDIAVFTDVLSTTLTILTNDINIKKGDKVEVCVYNSSESETARVGLDYSNICCGNDLSELNLAQPTTPLTTI